MIAPRQPTQKEIKEEIAQNYKAFSERSFEQADKGKFALMHKGELMYILDTKADAYKMGIHSFKYAGTFSIQEILPLPIDLGFMSYALRPS